MINTCPLCDEMLGSEVLTAATVLYGPNGFYGDRLKDAVEKATTNAETIPGLPAVTTSEKEEGIGQAAVLHALGISTFGALAKAFAHYGHFYECRGT